MCFLIRYILWLLMIQMRSHLIPSRYTRYKPTLPQPQSFRGFLDILSGFCCELRFLELLGLGGVSDDVFSDWTAIALADETAGEIQSFPQPSLGCRMLGVVSSLPNPPTRVQISIAAALHRDCRGKCQSEPGQASRAWSSRLLGL